MKDFLFFIYKKYFHFTKQFIQEKINVLNIFYKGLYFDYLTSRYKFHPGRRVIKPRQGYRRRRRQVITHDIFDVDKQKLLEETEKFYIILGSFINKYSSDKVHWHWNDYIWQPHREIKGLVENLEMQRLPVLPPPPITVPPSPTFSDFSETYTLPRRARRTFKPYPDTLASGDDERCKVCMTNKKIICFLPCGHIGMCNTCCAEIYKKRFIISLSSAKRPYICDTVPLPPENNLNYDDDESFMESIIDELTQPKYNKTRHCIFCKEKVLNFRLVFSV